MRDCRYNDTEIQRVVTPTSAMSEGDTDESSRRHSTNPYRKEQDPAIIEVFSKANHPVLTTKEIADELEHIGLKQTRRRLDDLVDEGVLETRKPSRDRIWWLVAEVQEPITVRYPLLRHVRDRFEVLVTVLGAALGLIGAFAIMIYLGLDANSMSLPVITRQDVLVFGLYSIALGISGMIGGVVAILMIRVGSVVWNRLSSQSAHEE